MVLNSFEAGYNNFKFEKNNFNGFGAYLRGDNEYSLLKLSVGENNGQMCFSRIGKADIHIGVNKGQYLIPYSTNSIIKLDENEGEIVGFQSKGITFILGEKVTDAKNFDGVATECIFKSPNKQFLDDLTRGSRFLIKPDGTEGGIYQKND